MSRLKRVTGRWWVALLSLLLTIGAAGSLALASGSPEGKSPPPITGPIVVAPDPTTGRPGYMMWEEEEGRMWAVLLPPDKADAATFSPEASTAITRGLSVCLRNQAGSPAISATVQVYPTQRSGDTNASGCASIDVADGTYTLFAYSWRDRFALVRYNVVAPGNVNMDTTGSVPLTFHVTGVNGAPVAGATTNLVPATGCFWGRMWGTDANGDARIDVTRTAYDTQVWSWAQRFLLVRENVTVTQGVRLDFPAATMPTGRFRANIVGADYLGIAAWAAHLCLTGEIDIPNGETGTYSATRYFFMAVDLVKRDVQGWNWRLFLDDVLPYPYTLPPGVTVTVQAGTPITATTIPNQSSYRPGDQVRVNNRFAEAYGHRIRGGWKPPAGNNYPRVQVFDPFGRLLVDRQEWAAWSQLSFTLPADAPEGRYRVEASLDTGPFSGMVHATAFFEVTASPPRLCSATGTVAGQAGRYYLAAGARVMAFLYGSIDFAPYLGKSVLVMGSCRPARDAMGPVPVFLAQSIQLWGPTAPKPSGKLSRANKAS